MNLLFPSIASIFTVRVKSTRPKLIVFHYDNSEKHNIQYYFIYCKINEQNKNIINSLKRNYK